jgi:hypothetical protein
MRLTAAAMLVMLSAPSWGAEAVCRDYTEAEGSNRSLFDGYIYGYVSAKTEDRDKRFVDMATLKVREMTNAYCLRRPDDSVHAAISTFTGAVARYSK